MRVETFLQEASPHVARWRSLSIASLGGRGEALALLPAKPVPNLEKLEITGFGHPEIRSIDLIAITIGDAAFPKLKDICISNSPVTIHATAFTTLRSFVLTGTAGSSLREIVGVLQNSPQLERLELWHCKRLKIAEQDWSVHPIMFERLTAVKLEKLHASVTNFILSIVHAPNCRRLTITYKIADPPHHSTLFNASVSHLLLPFKEGGLTRPPVDVVVRDSYTGPDEICITIRVGYMEIDIHGFRDGPSTLNSVLRWIGDYSGSEASFQASLAFTCRYVDPGYVEAFGPQFPVKHLSTTEPFGGSGMLEYLSHPGQHGGWPFPRLENLECLVPGNHSVIQTRTTPLLNMLTARYGHGGAEQSIMVEAPTPLKSIKLQCGGPPPDLLIQEIQKILSDVEITYV
ncbi:hypothetical protein FRC05_010971 [Tulasnella sp. 425]|nr:hypothetical protein FRC05_010971 [Tulasnella sp. 425]